MPGKSNISWTEDTWNAVTGCSRVSPGCDHCLGPDTPILMADMSWKPIVALKRGDEIVGFSEALALGQNRIYERSVVESTWATTAEAVEITVGDRTIIASDDHRFLARVRPYWREAKRLTLRTEVVDIGMPAWIADTNSEDYLAGYAAGVIKGDGTFRISDSSQSYMRVAVMESDGPILWRLTKALEALGCTELAVRTYRRVEGAAPMDKVETRRRSNLVQIRDSCLPERDSANWKAGYLAGMLDTDGSHNGSVRYNQTKPNDVLDCVQRYIADLGYVSHREDFRSASSRSERIAGNVEERVRFLATIQPALRRKAAGNLFGRRFPAKQGSTVDGVRRIGRQTLVDIQTSSGTFIAAGLATHNCYAEALSLRFGWSQKPWMPENAEENVVLHPERLSLPYKWRKPRMVFANSMSDLFHPRVPGEFINEVWMAMYNNPRHTFQVLTKRPKRLRDWTRVAANAKGWPVDEIWPDWMWVGTSIESRDYVDRADLLREVPAAVRFISAEPLLSPLVPDRIDWERSPAGEYRVPAWSDGEDVPGLDLDGIAWVICGGESGPGHRPMDLAWMREVKALCDREGVAFFAKQDSALRPDQRGRIPDDLWVQDFPRRSDPVTREASATQGTLL